MPENIQFFPLDAAYKIVDGKAVINLYGRMPDGRQICVLDSNFEPYFYAIPKGGINISEELGKIRIENENEVSFVTRTESLPKKFLGKEVFAVKIYTNLPSSVPVIRDAVRKLENVSSTHEFDVPYTRRYFIDKNITPLVLCRASGEFVSQKSRAAVFRAESIEQAAGDTLHSPKILAFDIETYSPFDLAIDAEKNPIIMLSLYSENFRKVFVWKKFRTEMGDIEFVNSESELIEKFKEAIDSFRPDILTGYFSDGFDLPYIKTRADKYKIKLDIGFDYSELRVKAGKETTAAINGITHLDIFKFIKRVMGATLETYSYDLNAVATELLDEQKHDVALLELADVWDNKNEDLEKFCKYCMHDSYLTYSLAVKMLPTIIEMVKIVGIPIYDASRMGFSQLVEWYIMKQAPQFNEIAPNKPDYNEIQKRRLQTYQGAFVFEPKPGLYKDIVVFDFRSLYPTIISSHNIGLDAIDCDCCSGTAALISINENERHWFCSKIKGFIPILIGDLITRRLRIKEIIKEQDEKFAFLDARQNSLKLLANSFYGYLGFFGARWYSVECARSVTAWGRSYIHKVIGKAQNEGFNVLYSDSLPYDRNVIIKFKESDIKIVKIGELYDKYKDVKGISTLAFDKNKKVVFKPILRIIRHEYNNKLLKIVTKYGSTVVTPQHSVYSFDKKCGEICLVDAKTLRRGDNLISLTNPQVPTIHKAGEIFDLTEMGMGSYEKELILYSDNLMFPAKFGKCPYCQKEHALASHVNLKHLERRQAFKKNSLFSWVGGKNAKTRKIPRYWVLDEELAWLLGYYCAEGSVTDVLTKTGRKCSLSFGCQDKAITEKVKLILDSKTGTSTEIIEDFDKKINKKMFYYRVQCMPIIALFNYGFGAGKGSEFKKVPSFIFTSDENLKRAFIKGYIDGDGNSAKDQRYKTHFIRFSTKSKELAIGLDFIFKSLPSHNAQFFGKEIKHIAWQYRKDKPKIQALRLQSAKNSYENFCLAEIRSIEEIKHQDYVYDLEVEGAHNFVDAEGMILVHNTDSIFLTLDGKSKKDAEDFVAALNSTLPGLMELEYEGFYPSGIFVSAKMGPYGAKKKYAMISEHGVLKIKGFETVRRNWSLIAKDVQEKVLDITLREHDTAKALDYVKSVIKDLRGKKIPLAGVIMHTQLTKEILDYANKGPHVAAAQRLINQGKKIAPGSIIKYVVTQGSDIIRNRVKLPDEVTESDYDSDYYIHNQVVPAVERIFNVLGYTKEDLLETKEQTKLAGFF